MADSSFFSYKSVEKCLREVAPGSYTESSIKKAREITEDLLKQIGKMSRELAKNAGKKRVTDQEIKLASKFFLK